MKTLDEVILCLDGCGHIDCDDCPYHYEDEKIEVDDCAQVYKDALHYLKEYKQTRQDLLDGMKRLEGKELMYIHALANLEDNPPLTWDELRQMEGKPVWVELTFPEGAYSHWGIIWGFPKAGYEFMELWGFHEIQSFSVMQKEQGKTWQAFRKERNE